MPTPIIDTPQEFSSNENSGPGGKNANRSNSHAHGQADPTATQAAERTSNLPERSQPNGRKDALTNEAYRSPYITGENNSSRRPDSSNADGHRKPHHFSAAQRSMLGEYELVPTPQEQPDRKRKEWDRHRHEMEKQERQQVSQSHSTSAKRDREVVISCIIYKYERELHYTESWVPKDGKLMNKSRDEIFNHVQSLCPGMKIAVLLIGLFVEERFVHSVLVKTDASDALFRADWLLLKGKIRGCMTEMKQRPLCLDVYIKPFVSEKDAIEERIEWSDKEMLDC